MSFDPAIDFAVFQGFIGGSAKRCPRGMRLQAVAFHKDKGWTRALARDWALAHGYPGLKVDDAKNYFRIRIEDPKRFMFFRWGRPWLDGLYPVYGCPKAKYKRAPARGVKTRRKVRPKRRVRKVAGMVGRVCVC